MMRKREWGRLHREEEKREGEGGKEVSERIVRWKVERLRVIVLWETGSNGASTVFFPTSAVVSQCWTVLRGAQHEGIGPHLVSGGHSSNCPLPHSTGIHQLRLPRQRSSTISNCWKCEKGMRMRTYVARFCSMLLNGLFNDSSHTHTLRFNLPEVYMRTYSTYVSFAICSTIVVRVVSPNHTPHTATTCVITVHMQCIQVMSSTVCSFNYIV